MKVKLFRQRISQVHEGEEEINSWLEEMADQITIEDIKQSAYMTDGREQAVPGYIVSVWYEDKN